MTKHGDLCPSSFVLRAYYECRMTKEARSTNDEGQRSPCFVICASGFFRHSTFVIRHFQRLPLAEKFRKLSAATMSSSPKTVPRHIAIIMDGNGRWAKSRGLP